MAKNAPEIQNPFRTASPADRGGPTLYPSTDRRSGHASPTSLHKATGKLRLAELRRQVQKVQWRYRGQPSSPRCPTGLPELDDVLGGGFALGAVHELLAGENGVAVHSVALRTAARAAGGGQWIL
jgi:predicted ATP-dependent serine protease